MLLQFGVAALRAGNTAARTREHTGVMAQKLGLEGISASFTLDSVTVSVKEPEGWLTAAREIGLRVPEDLSVIGVDGHDFAELFGLTTIDQFPHAQGERAGEAILAAVAGDGEPVGTSSSLPFALVTRRTTAPPRA